MLIFVFLLPILFAIIILIFFRDKAIWWEYLVLIVPSILITTSIYFGMISYTESDTEYIGEHSVSVKYYEPWNEYVHKTCYRTVHHGKTSTSVPYDCSYVDYHSEKWTQRLSNGKEYEISKAEYVRLCNTWNTSVTFIDMHRHYHTKDGDCYSKMWDGRRETSKSVTFVQSYKNKVKASRSIFGFTKIEPEEAKKLGLHDYPKLYDQSNGRFINNDNNQSPFIGYTPTKQELQQWEFINGYYGPKKQFRTYLLFFYNKPRSIVQDQKSYWEGGNKNEMVLCFGLDTITKQIQWVDAFSWCEKPTFEVEFKYYLQDKDKLDLMQLANWTEYHINKDWKRRHFEDFNYISIELSGTQITWLFIIIVLFNLGMTVYIINNEYYN